MTNQLSHPLQISFEPYLGYSTLLPLRGVGDLSLRKWKTYIVPTFPSDLIPTSHFIYTLLSSWATTNTTTTLKRLTTRFVAGPFYIVLLI